MLGLAVFHHQFVDAYFVPAYYEMVLNKTVNLKDLEAADYELYEGLTCQWTLCVQTSHSRIFTLTPLCFAGKMTSRGVPKETFTMTKDSFGKHVNVDLRSGSSSQDPTKSNQGAYVEPSSPTVLQATSPNCSAHS